MIHLLGNSVGIRYSLDDEISEYATHAADVRLHAVRDSIKCC